MVGADRPRNNLKKMKNNFLMNDLIFFKVMGDDEEGDVKMSPQLTNSTATEEGKPILKRENIYRKSILPSRSSLGLTTSTCYGCFER